MIAELSSAIAKLSLLIGIFSVALANGGSAEYSVVPPAAATYFSGYPELLKICSCESSGSVDQAPRQFLASGGLLWGNDPHTGRAAHEDVGMCQIHVSLWAEKAKSLGFDLFTAEGNSEMAKWLWDKYGASPWAASRPCHKVRS